MAQIAPFRNSQILAKQKSVLLSLVNLVIHDRNGRLPEWWFIRIQYLIFYENLIAVPPAQYHDKELAQVIAVFDQNKSHMSLPHVRRDRQKGRLLARVCSLKF
jgi:hypothetical protein